MTSVPESKLQRTGHGLVANGDGWFVLNLRDAEWRHADGRGAVSVALDDFEGRRTSKQLGVNVFVPDWASRWPCTTGRPTRRASSWSPAKRP